MRFAWALAALTFIVVGCSKNSGKGGGGQIRLIKGDPNVFIQSAESNLRNSLEERLPLRSDKWSLSLRGFQEEKVEQPKDDIESGEEAPDPAGVAKAEQEQEDNVGTFQRSFDGEKLTFKNDSFVVRFARDEMTGTIQLASFESATGEWPPYYVGREIRVLHTSFNEKAFSILIQSQLASDRFVLDLNFSPSGAIPEAIKTAERFKYLLGTGLKFAWDQTEERPILLCGNPSPGSVEAFERAVRAWQVPLQGRLDLTYYRELRCPPFSDVNTQVVNFIDDWIEVVGPQAKAAFATPTFNYPLGEISDADIFFLREEWAEGYALGGYNLKAPGAESNPRIIQAYYETLTHEMGHLLGLHHQFDEGIPSIMGYNDIDSLTTYDVNAIQSLYPKRTAP